MYPVHLAVVIHIPELKFTQALGPRDELDQRQSLRTSTTWKLNVCLEPASTVTQISGLMLHGDSSTPQKCGGYVQFIYFSVNWITPLNFHDFGEMKTKLENEEFTTTLG